MARRITYPRDVRDHAKATGKLLVAFGYEDDARSMDVLGPLEAAKARFLLAFVPRVISGMGLREAWDEAHKAAREDKKRLRAIAEGYAEDMANHP